MRMTGILFFLFAITIACSPKVKTKLSQNNLSPLSYSDPLVILDETESVPAEGIKIGVIKTGDKGLSINCSYVELIELIKERSRLAGANLIKITKRKYPDLITNCDRITADLYSVSNIKKYENEITWTSGRRLSWEDFKRVENGSNAQGDFNALSHCGILAQTGRMHIWASGKVFVNAVFYTNNSWVNSNRKDSQFLEHEQLHFDLAELYARKMRKAFNEAGMTGSNVVVMVDFVHRKYFKEYKERIEVYENETDYGHNYTKQRAWNQMIKEELDELHGYLF